MFRLCLGCCALTNLWQSFQVGRSWPHTRPQIYGCISATRCIPCSKTTCTQSQCDTKEVCYHVFEIHPQSVFAVLLHRCCRSVGWPDGLQICKVIKDNARWTGCCLEVSVACTRTLLQCAACCRATALHWGLTLPFLSNPSCLD